MIFIALRRSTLDVYQLASRCFCQGSSISTHHTMPFLQLRRAGLLKNFLFKKNIINNTSIIQSSALHQKSINNYFLIMSEKRYSTSNENQGTQGTPLSNKEKLKQAVKDYGATVILFHVTMSLMSLGTSYLIISSGVDVGSLLDKVGFSSANDVATGASTFVVAYAVHKLFAPVRISITLGATPFIVRYLRRVGILKPPKSTKP